jgi:hypothetical protein
MDEGEYLQPSRPFIYTERSAMIVLVDANGVEIRDSVRCLCPSARFGMEMLTFPLDPLQLVSEERWPAGSSRVLRSQ